MLPGLPHHVTRRGNRRQTVLISDADYDALDPPVATTHIDGKRTEIGRGLVPRPGTRRKLPG